eukprot:843592-Rhodomonas_salina.2
MPLPPLTHYLLLSPTACPVSSLSLSFSPSPAMTTSVLPIVCLHVLQTAKKKKREFLRGATFLGSGPRRTLRGQPHLWGRLCGSSGLSSKRNAWRVAQANEKLSAFGTCRIVGGGCSSSKEQRQNIITLSFILERTHFNALTQTLLSLPQPHI